eukprot:PhF_6_TR12582/c0_g3_i1/m.19790
MTTLLLVLLFFLVTGTPLVPNPLCCGDDPVGGKSSAIIWIPTSGFVGVKAIPPVFWVAKPQAGVIILVPREKKLTGYTPTTLDVPTLPFTLSHYNVKNEIYVGSTGCIYRTLASSVSLGKW